MTQIFHVFVLMVTSLFCGTGCGPENDPPPDYGLPIFTFDIRADESSKPVQVHAEIASTSPQRQQGLMYRETMSENRGMFFIFKQDTTGGFWMRNTILPLTIAYISSDGRVVDTRDGKPYDETLLTPSAAYRYVLEVNQGWFERHGLGIGSIVTLPEGLPEPQ